MQSVVRRDQTIRETGGRSQGGAGGVQAGSSAEGADRRGLQGCGTAFSGRAGGTARAHPAGGSALPCVRRHASPEPRAVSRDSAGEGGSRTEERTACRGGAGSGEAQRHGGASGRAPRRATAGGAGAGRTCIWRGTGHCAVAGSAQGERTTVQIKRKRARVSSQKYRAGAAAPGGAGQADPGRGVRAETSGRTAAAGKPGFGGSEGKTG